MTDHKARVKNIARRVKPAHNYTVIFEDLDQRGVYYDHSIGSRDRKLVTPEEIQHYKSDPNTTLIIVNFADNAEK
jgi:hypothetical protein